MRALQILFGAVNDRFRKYLRPFIYEILLEERRPGGLLSEDKIDLSQSK
jgi:hypothetical protein